MDLQNARREVHADHMARVIALQNHLSELYRQVGRLGEMIEQGGCCPTEEEIEQYRRKARWITTLHERYHSRRAAFVRDMTNRGYATSTGPMSVHNEIMNLPATTPFDPWFDNAARDDAWAADKEMADATAAHADTLDLWYRGLERTETALNRVTLVLGPVAVVRQYAWKKGTVIVAASLVGSAAVGRATGFAANMAVQNGWATEEQVMYASLFIRSGMVLVACKGAGGGQHGGLTTPRSFFGRLLPSQARAALQARFGSPRYNVPGKTSWFNRDNGRSIVVHDQPGHGGPHIDVTRRGNYRDRRIPLKEE